jgi:hypothetical protein
MLARLAIAFLLIALGARADSLPAVNSTLGIGIGTCSGALCAPGVGPLVSLKGANFNVTTDQALAIPAKITTYHISKIVITNCSVSMTTAAGGFYTAASKGGVAIVANTQVYSALTAAGVGLEATIVAAGLTSGTSYRLTAANIYLSLTTAQGAAATCDVYLFGDDLT